MEQYIEYKIYIILNIYVEAITYTLCSDEYAFFCLKFVQTNNERYSDRVKAHVLHVIFKEHGEFF